MDEMTFSGFSASDVSKMLMFNTDFDKLQPNFGKENLQLLYMVCDSFVLNIRTLSNSNDSKILEDFFEFCNQDKNHEKFSKKNKRVSGKFKIETPKNIWIDEIICLESKVFSFKCGKK